MQKELTTPVLIEEPTDTINLAAYFFNGRYLNWKNVNLVVEKWAEERPDEEELELSANADPPDEPGRVEFWICYQNIELVFEDTEFANVEWCPMNEAGFKYTTSSIILPRDGTELLECLGLTDYPDAQDILAFWERLLWFLETHLQEKGLN